MDRIDIGQALLCVGVLVVMGALVIWGPEDHKATVWAALIGLLTTLVAALRGRLVKRAPEQFK